MIQLKVVNDTRKPKADGTCPIYYRITEKKKVAYIYSGFAILPTQWDENKNQVKKSHPNAQTINSSISKRYFELQKAIIELQDDELYSLDSLKEKIAPKTEIQYVKQLADIIIAEMFAKFRTGNALVYQTGVNNLFKFKPIKGLRFTDITVQFIERYVDWLSANGCKVNTIGNYLRTLRAIYNKAIKLKVVDRKHYPFHDISIKTEKTAKRALTKATIVAIEKLPLLGYSPICKARDYYMLSFYLIGMNFTDVAYLKPQNISDNRIEYRRKKTGHDYSIKILPKACTIINKYSCNGKYIFPILPDDIVENSLQAKRLIQQWIKTTNKYLKRISETLGFEKPITCYSSRHSFATIAKRLGYSKELISEALGHQQGNQITEIYLDKFDKEVIDALVEHVVS
jgi:integrase/recombinase XerD